MILKNKSGQPLFKRRAKVGIFVAGIIASIIILISAKSVVSYTSSDKYCMVCHVHPHADQ
jgi:nitrate/TMAO reductase-like tetraheme cytochrome c subunit